MYLRLIVSILFFTGYTVAAQGKPGCLPANYEEVDKCARSMFPLSGTDSELPVTVEEIDGHCRLVEANLKCVDTFSRKCFASFQRQLTSVGLYTVRRNLQKYCKKEDQKKFLARIMECIHTSREDLSKLIQRYGESMSAIKSLDTESKIKISCCEYYKLKRSSLKTLRESGNERCDSTTIKNVETFVDGFTEELLDMVCAKYPPGRQTCKGYTVPKVKSQGNLKSFFLPAIELFATI